jgi:hypothetical protein
MGSGSDGGVGDRIGDCVADSEQGRKKREETARLEVRCALDHLASARRAAPEGSWIWYDIDRALRLVQEVID